MEFNVYRLYEDCANIEPLRNKRDWMDETLNSHAYRCMPLSLANSYGWGISFPEDISFIMIEKNHSGEKTEIKILKGERFAHAERRNSLVTFRTGLMFKTGLNSTLFTYPVPNQFIDGVESLSAFLNTELFKGEHQPSLRVNQLNKEITIKAGTPIFAIMPIDLEKINNSTFNILNGNILPEHERQHDPEQSRISVEMNKQGKWTNFYKNAVNHLGQPVSPHQVKRINLFVREKDV